MTPEFRPLFSLQLDVPGAHLLGNTPVGDRRLACITVGLGRRLPQGPVYDLFELL